MPTVIFVHIDGSWQEIEENVYKWNQGMNPMYVVIPVDDDICEFRYLQNEVYRAGNVDRTTNLKFSYFLSTPGSTGLLYVRNDFDLRAYFYLGGFLGAERNRPAIHVEIENATTTSLPLLELNTEGPLNRNWGYDAYFRLNITPLDRIVDGAEDVLENENENPVDLNDDVAADLNDEEGDTNCELAAHLNEEVGDKYNEIHARHDLDDTGDDIPANDSIQSFSFSDGSDLVVGQEFPNKQAVKKELQRLSLEGCFEVDIVKTCKTVYALKCAGSHCNWRIWTAKITSDPHAFSIRTYCNTHTCCITGTGRRAPGASSGVVRDMLVDNFQGDGVTIKPKAVMTMMRNTLNTEISYFKAWRGKQLAEVFLKGDPSKSYGLLPCYLHMLKQKNRGSITDIVVDEKNQFKYMFLAFGACISGYNSMRKVVSIDGTWLKTKYRGVLLVASAQDGNFHQFPLAWGIVDSENNSSWTWFLTKLLEVVPDEDGLVIISDRHLSIIHAVSNVYKNAHHGHCTWHLSQNMKTRCKKKGATEMFLEIAKIYQKHHFDAAYLSFSMRFPEAAQFLNERDTTDRWTRAYCPSTRYNIMTTNGVESINSVLREERKLPIIALLDSLQCLTSSWFARHRQSAIESSQDYTPSIEKILRKRYTESNAMKVYTLGLEEFDVRNGQDGAIVDLGLKSCTCRVFDIDRIPCAHAMAACRVAKKDIYSLCSDYYSTVTWCMAYSEKVYPVPKERDWPPNIESDFQLVLPPPFEKKVGRRKEKRFPSLGEFVSRRRSRR